MSIFDILREKIGETSMVNMYNFSGIANGDYIKFENIIDIVKQVEQEFGNPTLCYLGGPLNTKPKM